MNTSAPNRSNGLEITLIYDPESPAAIIELLCVAVWPNNQKRRGELLATLCGVLFGSLQDPPPGFPNLSDAHKLRMRTEWEQKIFQPTGGFKTIANAPSWEQLWREMGKAYTPALIAGEILFRLAAMVEHHSDIRPSLNRVMAIIEANFLEKRNDKSIVADWVYGPASNRPIFNERALKAIWKRWKCVAPLWAGFYYEDRVLKLTLWPDADHILLHDDKTSLRMQYILQTASWFREFAVKFRADRARVDEVLIPEAEALMLRPVAAPLKPRLLALGGHLLVAAEKYTVKALRQDG